MADNKLEIIITAKDNASGPLGKIGSALGGMAQIAGGFIVANLFGKIADSVTGFFSDSLSEARESISVHKQLEQVIKSTGGVAGITADEADKLASSLSKVTNFSDDTIVSAENMLLTFTNVGEKVFPRATETILDMSQALGQDTKSSAIQLGKALNDPIKGITALSRVGVTFTEQQKDMIKAMVEAGDIAGAQGVILDELAKEFGGSAQALADPAIQLQNAWANAKEEVGMAVIPVLNKLSQIALPMISSAIQFVIPYIETLGGWLLSLIEYVTFTISSGDSLNDWLTHFPEFLQPAILWIGNLIVAIQDLGAWIFGTAIPALRDWGNAYVMPALDTFVNVVLPYLWSKAQEIWGWIQDVAIPTLQDWGNTFSEAVVPIIQDFVNNILPLMWTKAQEIWTWITSTAIPGLQEWGNTITEYLTPKFAELRVLLDKFMLEVLPLLQEAWETLAASWRDDIAPALSELWGSLKDLFVTLGFGTGKTDGWKIVLGFLKLIILGVTQKIRELTPTIKLAADGLVIMINFVKSGIDKFIKFKQGVEGIIGAVKRLIDKIRDMANKLKDLAIPDWVMGNSPSPFELSLNGIAKAMNSMPDLQTSLNIKGGGALAAASPVGGLGGSLGSSIIINLTYSPAVSLADKLEAEQVLAPFIANGVRNHLAGKR